MRLGERDGSFGHPTELLIKPLREQRRPQAIAQSVELRGRVHRLIPRACIAGVIDRVAEFVDGFG
jgi:hypothetical protein